MKPIIWAEKKKELLLFFFFKSGWHTRLKHPGAVARTTERIRVANVCVQSGPDHEGKSPVLSGWGCGSCPLALRPSKAREYCAVYCQLREKIKKSSIIQKFLPLNYR